MDDISYKCPGCGKPASAEMGKTKYCKECNAFVHIACMRREVNDMIAGWHYHYYCPICDKLVFSD
jgi:hypothetical protein